eukprot:1147351-Pelagomonas_calceolata.AAC.4
MEGATAPMFAELGMTTHSCKYHHGHSIMQAPPWPLTYASTPMTTHSCKHPHDHSLSQAFLLLPVRAHFSQP